MANIAELTLAGMLFSSVGNVHTPPDTVHIAGNYTFSMNTLLNVFALSMHTIPSSYTHYVSATSVSTDWNAAQNINTPCNWQTAMANAVGSNVVGFRGGEYVIDCHGGSWDTPIMRPTNVGSLGNPIIFMAYEAEVPHVTKVTPTGTRADVTTALAATAFGCDTGDQYIIWDGFKGTLPEDNVYYIQFGDYAYNTSMLFYMYGATNCIARNCELIGIDHGPSQSGGNTAMMGVELCNGCEIYNNSLHSNRRLTLDSTDNNTCSIWVFADTNSVFHNNEMYGNAIAVGQKTGPNRGTQYQYNFVHDNYLYGWRIVEELPAGQALSCTIENTLAVDNDTFVFIEGSPGPAIDWIIRNNTVVRHVWGVFTIANVTGTEIYNNIFHNCTWETNIIYSTYPPDVQDYNVGYPSFAVSDNWGFTAEYYSLAAWQAASIFDDNSSEADPVFANGAGSLPADFVLQAGSPFLGNGLGGVNRGVINLALVGIQ